MKDWIKVLIAALTGTLVTLLISSIFAYPGNITKKFNETEVKIIEAERAAYKYTDNKITEHEKLQSEQYKNLTSKQDFTLKYLDQRFNDLEKRLK